MIKNCFRTGFIPVLIYLLFWQDLNAQPSSFPSATLEQKLARAEAYLISFKNDSAIALTSNILKELKTSGHVDTPFGIRVQLAEANAYEHDQQGALAIEKLLQVQQKSQAMGLWEIHAKACLVLALLYEKNELKERSREQLDLAKADIVRYKLATVYPYFAVRRSSWERLYGDNQKALFFAREALRTAPTQGLLLEEAISHMLLNILLPASAIDERMQYCVAAVRLYQKLGDQVGRSYMFGGIASIYYEQGNFRQALAYNDSTLIAINQGIAEGHERDAVTGSIYRFRSRIYQQLGQPDSALTNLRKGYEIELAYTRSEIRDKIIEIESRYQVKYKQQQIDEQQLALSLKNNQLHLSIAIVLLLGASAVILSIGYWKLIRQNKLIQQQASQLKFLDSAKSHFFANVSHELRTPLTLLLGPISTLLAKNQLTAKQTYLLQLAQRSGLQLKQLVNDILDLNKLELGKLELNLQPTPVAPFFRSHLAQFESLAMSRDLHYTFVINADKDAVVRLDQPKYRQILNNLLANAFKFTPAGGCITATLILTDSKLHLQVTDTGPGIHPDDLPHLFDRYFQTTRPAKPAEGGTGIGLALCQEYVRLMGGTIEVESSPGTGSVFRVMLPVVLMPTSLGNLSQEPRISDLAETGWDFYPPVRPLQEDESTVWSTATRPTILVVEDNPDLQAYIRFVLSTNYEVVTAGNGQEAIELLRTNRNEPGGISLVLSDIMMPLLDGHQLLERLKTDENTRHLPVIMLTARAGARDKLKALRIGVDDYLLKPFDEEELLARITNLLANQAIRRQAIDDDKFLSGPMQSRTLQADQEWLEKFEEYVQQHLADPSLSIPELTEEFAMSESTLLRQLKRLTGLSPVQYVQAVRLEEARRLLENRSEFSIAQIANQVGYSNARAFTRSFRTRFGNSPSRLRETVSDT